MAAVASELADVQPRVALRADLLLPEVGRVGFGDLFIWIFGLLCRLENLHAFDVRLFLGALRVNSTRGVAYHAADQTHESGLVLPQQERDGLPVILRRRLRHLFRRVAIELASRPGDLLGHVPKGLFH